MGNRYATQKGEIMLEKILLCSVLASMPATITPADGNEIKTERNGFLLSSPTYNEENSRTFDIDSFTDYERKYVSISIGACGTSSSKTYEDYKLITAPDSAQYKYIQEHMTVDETTGFLYNENGFIGAALGYQFGDIGSEYYFVLDTGVVLPIVKIDAKAAAHANDGCMANSNANIIEFVIDTAIAKNYFFSTNGYVCNGNFNNYPGLAGKIVDVESADTTTPLPQWDESNITYVEYSSEVLVANTVLIGRGEWDVKD